MDDLIAELERLHSSIQMLDALFAHAETATGASVCNRGSIQLREELIAQAANASALSVHLPRLIATLKAAEGMRETIWLLTKTAGGQIEIPSSVMLEFNRKTATIETHDDPATGNKVVRAYDAAKGG